MSSSVVIPHVCGKRLLHNANSTDYSCSIIALLFTAVLTTLSARQKNGKRSGDLILQISTATKRNANTNLKILSREEYGTVILPGFAY
jgi:hypothetical protein